jgi:hypothetical protein
MPDRVFITAIITVVGRENRLMATWKKTNWIQDTFWGWGN